jgi:hypothetical protein
VTKKSLGRQKTLKTDARPAAVNCVLNCVMSDHEEDSNRETEFNFAEWVTASKLTEPGRKKLQLNAIVDLDNLTLISDKDVGNIRLAAGDRAKFERALAVLRGPVGAQDLSGAGRGASRSRPSTSGTVGQEFQQGTSQGTVQGVQQNPLVGGTQGTQSVQGQQPPFLAGQAEQSFSLSEVAAFLAGGGVPPDLQVAVNSVYSQTVAQQSHVTPQPSTSQPSWKSPSCFQPSSQTSRSTIPVYSTTDSLQSALAGLQLGDNGKRGQVIQGVYNRAAPVLPTYQSLQGTSRDSSLQLPSSSLGHQASLPSRQSLLFLSGSGQSLQAQAHLRDLLGINECALVKSGEGLLLPVNFCSHVRGSRSEDEELLHTPSGAKLVLSLNGKKLVPEKLNQGLFFGAQARILARMIPNLTPQTAIYLDYLRQLGDFLVNYTSTSVYCLDHEHRYEVAALGRPWNEISTGLSLNWLKKKDVPSTGSNNAASNHVQNRSTPSTANMNFSRSQVMCYQFNQPDGCQYAPNCRFPHKCSVEGCYGDHPAYKHNFRCITKNPPPQQSQQQSSGSQAPKN